MTMPKLLVILFAVAVNAGCAANLKTGQSVDWDPPQGRALFEQIPAWDGAAQKICCGHLRSCQPHQSPRC